MKYCASCHATYPSDVITCPKDNSALRTTSELLQGMIIRGKYEILERIGVGGMAWVYRARHLMFNEIRAIKILRSWMADEEDFIRRLKAEAVIARRLQHPNAVRVDDLDQMEDGRPFIVMEYVQGADVHAILQKDGPMSAARALSISDQVLSALAAAHRLGITHRDIKPDNIVLVKQPDGSDQVKVLDFGIAKLREADSSGKGGTKTGFIICTPEYASPEQARASRQVDGRSDLYSVGMVMYEMLTSALPFHADSQFAMLLHQINTDPLPPTDKFPSLKIPRVASDVVMKALEKEPENRFQTAEEMREAVLAALEQCGGRYAPTQSNFSDETMVAPRVIPIDRRERPTTPPVEAQVARTPTPIPASTPTPTPIPPPQPVSMTPPPQSVSWAGLDDSSRERPSQAALDLLVDDEPEEKNRIWLWAMCATAVILIVAGIFMYGIGSSRQKTSGATTASQSKPPDDATVLHNVETTLAPFNQKGGRISAFVQNGTVTLYGVAPSEQMVAEAKAGAMKISGEQVITRVEVIAPKAKIPDDHIREDVDRELTAPDLQPSKITASVKDGIVTLTGEASQQTVIDRAVHEVSHVPGVVKIANDIQLKQAIAKPSPLPAAGVTDTTAGTDASAAADRPAEEGPGNRRARQLIARARQLDKAEKFDAALEKLDQAMKVDPTNQEAADLAEKIEQEKAWVEQNEGGAPTEKPAATPPKP